MNEPSASLYETWTNFEVTAALILIILSSTFCIFYFLTSALIRNRSSKYRFVYGREVNVLKFASFGLAIAIGLIIHSFLIKERDFTHMFIFSLKAGIPIAVTVGFAFAANAYFNVYYPFILESRLADIRFRERKHPKNGRPMHLLNEEEEDKYLTDEMIRQEEEFRYDFDVWLDQLSGDTIIETYKGSTNKICGQCNFRTLKLVKEEIDDRTNTNTLYYVCSHCGNKEYEEG